MNSRDNEDVNRIAAQLGAEYRDKLTRGDFASFESATGLQLPDSLRSLYSNTTLLLSTPGCFAPDFWIQNFSPLPPFTETFIFNGRTMMHLACGDDGEPILADLTGDTSRVPLLVQWDQPGHPPDDIEDLGITLEALLQREWRPT
ncbi:hypothetical protein [Rhodopirellula baltica]|nr:hypothetical protein [Rhodopirellula baltica]